MAEAIPAFHLPGLDVPVRAERFGALELALPRLTPDTVAQACELLAAARERHLARLRTDEVVERCDRAIRAWLAPGSRWRLLAERSLPDVTGYHPEMVRLGLRRQMKRFRRAELRRFLAADFGDPGVLDGFRPRPGGGFARACGPRLMAHVFAGNVPGLPAWSLVAALLLRAASFGKTARGEPVFASLFARHLAEVDPELGSCVAVAWWPGGEQALEAALFARADAVVAYGSDASVDAVRRRLPLGVRLVAHGHRLSAAFVGREALAPDLAAETVRRAGQDVAWWDQQSCLSPQAVFVETGGRLTPLEFARLVAAELARLGLRRPRAPLAPEEHAAIVRWRGEQEVRQLAGAGVELYAGADWTVVYDPEPAFGPTPLNRSVRVVPVAGPDQAAAAMAPWRGALQTVAIAVDAERLLAVAGAFAGAGARRVAALGASAEPEAGWHDDGRLFLGDLVTWADVEAAAADLAESLDREVEEDGG